MALETLKDVKDVGGFEINHTPYQPNRNFHVLVNHDTNTIAFTIQNGPIKEKGVNGCQVDTMIEAAKLIIEGLNDKFPCRENSMTITKLDEALMWLNKRKQDREKRSVEGLNKI